jgi:hypothetical protein
VKISTMRPSRSSAPRAPDDTAHRGTATLGCALTFSEDATTIVILPALSDFCEGRPAPLLPAGPATAGISPCFSETCAFLCVLCVKSFAFLSAACRQMRQFLFRTNELLPNSATHSKQTTSFSLCDANECLSWTFKFAIHTKQITSIQITALFLFDTNERLHKSRNSATRSNFNKHQRSKKCSQDAAQL